MKHLAAMALLLICVNSTARAASSVIVQDFEKASLKPGVWVVNIPNENASVRLSTEQPHDGRQCLALHYHFLDKGNFQYLGIPNKVRIQAPIHELHYWLKGDDSKCSYGVQVSDASGETHQYSQNTGQCGTIDFTGWKEVVIDIDSGHETWGGDKNGRLDYPITAITFTVAQPKDGDKLVGVQGDLAFDSMSVVSGRTAAETLGGLIAVTSPAYCSDIRGRTTVAVSAPGFKSLNVTCWRQGAGFGADSTVATVALDAAGKGSFVFPADDYPHGPITLKISGASDLARDNCYLQLYNKGGVPFHEGMPKDPPPAAKGMSLVFADDFNGPLSISSTDPKATYYDHKPPNGWQDFSKHTFMGHDSARNPFGQVDTYLRITASDKARSAGLISSLKNDGSGIKASVPCYFECRFIGPNAIGTWPGFWLMTDYMMDWKTKGARQPVDELDIIEAYGGEGRGHPNAGDSYMISPHCWNQADAGRTLEKKAYAGLRNPIHMRKFGIPPRGSRPSIHTAARSPIPTPSTTATTSKSVAIRPFPSPGSSLSSS